MEERIMQEGWKNGRVEGRQAGKTAFSGSVLPFLFFHSSILPTFQPSNLPTFQGSVYAVL
jgi:hypothetical protein